MGTSKKAAAALAVTILLTLACSTLTLPAAEQQGPTALPARTLIPADQVQNCQTNPDEPVLITGTIPYTSPFFVNSIAEPFVMLEDQAGFVNRDREFVFPLESQMIGPVRQVEDGLLSFSLPLPIVPQGTLIDVDQDGSEDPGVMIFQIAYWSNTWGDPFLEARDGTGWSTAYTAAITDPDREDEISGGTILIWSPDDQQEFPVGFGADGKLFNADDPVETVAQGYSLVNMDQEPFRIYKERQPDFVLYEGEGAVTDLTDLSYADAFDALFNKASVEYPFTIEKNVNWNALYDEFSPRMQAARTDADFYRAMHEFILRIPDGHAGMTIDPNIFFEEQGGSFGLRLRELSDGRVLVVEVIPQTPAAREGIAAGAEITSWNGLPILEAIASIEPYFGPYSTDHHKRLEQATFLTRTSPNEQIQISYQNPGEQEKTVTLTAEVEYDSLFASIEAWNQDELMLPLEGEVLEDAGIGYISISTFSDDLNLMARLWEYYLDGLIENNIPALIIDLRNNGGGSGGLAMDFAGYFFDETIELSRRSYYNELTGEFEEFGVPSRIQPAPFQYDGAIAVMVGPNCASACEGFANALTRNNRAVIVGHAPTAGMYGEVGRGQYELPGEYSLQFPTGRPETPQGELLIEGTGVIPDILVPVTEESVFSIEDTVLNAAIDALLDILYQ